MPDSIETTSRDARARAGTRPRLRIGRVWVDSLTHDEALAEIDALVRRGRGGAVYTPNVDHIVLSERNTAFRRAYRQASLSLADGVPVVWASWLLRPPLPAKLSGSDMVWPVARIAAARGWRVYLLGGGPNAAAAAAERFRADCNLTIVGVDDARVSAQPDPEGDAQVLARIRAARPDLILVALGSPKGELWIHRLREQFAPAVAIGVGASLDFVAGHQRRAPRVLSTVGLEWLYRLVREPRRLWRRYLVQDPVFLLIVLRTLRLPRASRVRTVTRIVRHHDVPDSPHTPTATHAATGPAWRAEPSRAHGT